MHKGRNWRCGHRWNPKKRLKNENRKEIGLNLSSLKHLTAKRNLLKQNKTKQKTDRYNGQSGRKKTSIGREHVKDDFMWRSWGPHLSFAGSDARSNRIGICCHLWFPWIWMPEAPCCTPRQILITLVLTFESKPSCLKESWLHPTYFSHSNPAEEDRRIWICW